VDRSGCRGIAGSELERHEGLTVRIDGGLRALFFLCLFAYALRSRCQLTVRCSRVKARVIRPCRYGMRLGHRKPGLTDCVNSTSASSSKQPDRSLSVASTSDERGLTAAAAAQSSAYALA